MELLKAAILMRLYDEQCRSRDLEVGAAKLSTVASVCRHWWQTVATGIALHRDTYIQLCRRVTSLCSYLSINCRSH